MSASHELSGRFGHDVLPGPLMKPGVLVIRDQDDATDDCMTCLRGEGIPAWSTRTASHMRWLLQQTWVRPALSLVDLRAVSPDRSGCVARLASLVAESSLPTVLLGAAADEAKSFGAVLAILAVDAEPAQLISVVRFYLT